MHDNLTQRTREALAAAILAASARSAERDPYTVHGVAFRAGLAEAMRIVETATVPAPACGAQHLVVVPPGSKFTDLGIDDSACEPHRHTRDVAIDRPAPFRDRVIVTVRVDDAPSLSAAFAGRPVPSPELGEPQPPAETFRAAAERWLTYVGRCVDYRTHALYTTRLRLGAYRVIGDVPVGDVGSDHLVDVITRCRTEGNPEAGITETLTLINRVLWFAGPLADPAPSTSATPAPSPSTLYVVRDLSGDDHPAEGVYLSEAAAEAAAHVIAGDGATSYTPDGDRCTVVRMAHGRLGATVLAMPLHTDDSPHGLPVVDQAAVAAALDIEAGLAEVLASVDPCDPAEDETTPCGAPGPVSEHTDCARPAGHSGAHSIDAAYVDPPHVCPPPLREVFAVLVTDGGRAVAVEGAAYASRDEANEVVAVVGELHPDIRVVRLELDRGGPYDGMPTADVMSASEMYEYDPAEDEPYQGLAYGEYDGYEPAEDRE